MHYTVIARFSCAGAAEFHRLLTDGAIESRKTDGKEIVAEEINGHIEFG